MMEKNRWTIETRSVEETQALAQHLGERCQGGEVIALSGDLGTGKTSFVQGLARGLGVGRRVNSPTFTIVKEYQGRQLPLYHMDVYRLEDELEELGLEEYMGGSGVTVIEWPERIAAQLPEEHLHIRLEKLGEDRRQIIFTPRGKRYQLLIKEVLA